MLPDTDYAAQDHDYADDDGADADADALSNALLLLSRMLPFYYYSLTKSSLYGFLLVFYIVERNCVAVGRG